MSDLRAVRGSLAHVWSLFFMRHGRLTAIQSQAIPPILEGKDALVIAATASGKTEAVLGPLLERYWSTAKQPGLHILYITPTRALVRSLYDRVQTALADTPISAGMKTGDIRQFNPAQAPAILLTTPESTDSLLTRFPRMFVTLQAIVLDEIHLLDNTARGDHLRCLLARLERIREYALPDAAPAQRVALSATIFDPPGVSNRYLREAVIVQTSGARRIEAEIRPLYDLEQLIAALVERPAKKSLLFCNSRREVEETAAYLRRHLPYHADVFVHYSNLDAHVRQEVEDRFAALPVAVCVCTSTLELGIDIGSVDDVILLGAPPDLTSFLQRIGRGGRREPLVRVLCLARAPGEWARFEALLSLAGDWRSPENTSRWMEEHSPLPAPQPLEDVSAYDFRPAVLVQQIFSMIKQSPTGALRLADVRRIAPAEVPTETVRQIISHLSFTGYLQAGRPGEWKPGPELQELIDRHDIYSNIGSDSTLATAVDSYSGAVIARTERTYARGTVLLFAGKPMEVVWREGLLYGLAPTRKLPAEVLLPAQEAFAAVPFAVAQTVARGLGYGAREMALLPDAEGAWLFHWLGTIWGELLAAMLLESGIAAEQRNEYCLHLRRPLNELPAWDRALVQRVALRKAPALAGRLQMGRFHALLPAHVADAATIQLLNLPRFVEHCRQAAVRPAATAEEKLYLLAGA